MKLIAALLTLAAFVAGACYVRALRADLANMNRLLVDARKGIAARDSTLQQVRDDAAQKATQQMQFTRAHDAIASKLEATRLENRRLTYETDELRAWADTRLPDDVVRLHTSPTLASANDYIERVPGGQPMHATGYGAANER
ncbi:protein lysB [Paraburkholderia sp. NMBU_R16]|uniref:protein lysB n=1 Tax=Paraburkholderia sp. NMBU_R16 TaxID=2698676 RepID=UPI001567BA4D|nr:protein lysB [Paraburkholderia sp. NMBU_R16]NRO99452.1 protein lysB [Paraburkholderia sp. NMBU_R16]